FAAAHPPPATIHTTTSRHLYRSHQDLHSFPTRRSSDLATMIREAEQKVKDEVNKNAKELLTYAVQKCAADHSQETTVSIVALPRDRKSTRLNSSHVSISYAVFCLKKKKKQKVDGYTTTR